MKRNPITILILSTMLLLSACGNQSERMQPVGHYEAYTALLWQYYEATTHLEAEETWMFTLYDINGDGVPELIIWESIFGSFFFTAHSAYTFANGDVHRLEIDESFGDNGSVDLGKDVLGINPELFIY